MATIPLTVLTGFLGSGKTTLLRHALADSALAGTAVIINEFGTIGCKYRCFCNEIRITGLKYHCFYNELGIG